MEERVSRGCHRDEARKVPLGVNPLGVPNPTTVWVTSGQTTTREGEQPNPSADNWSEVLLSKALPTRAKNSFSHCQSLPSTSLHKLLSLIHQRADRKSKKHSITAAKMKTILQKVNHNEKAESYVPDEGTR